MISNRAHSNVFTCFVTLAIYVGELIFLLSYPKDGLSSDYLIRTYSLISSFNLVLQVLTLKKRGFSIISPIVLFFIFCYIFHFGQVVAENLFVYDYLNYLDAYMIRDIENLEKTLRVSVISIACTHLGAMMISPHHAIEEQMKTDLDETRERDKCGKVGIVLFTLSTPFRLFIDIKQLIVALSSGYLGAIHAVSVPGVVAAIAGFWYSSLIFIYIEKRRKTILLFGIIYSAISMLTGNRGHQITNLIVMLIVYIKLEGIKLRPKQIFKYSVLIYVGLVFVDVIMSFRKHGISDFISNFSYYIGSSLKTNIVFETVGSFGETLYTPYLVVKGINNNLVNPRVGEAWLYSIFTLFPNIGGLTSNAILYANYPKMLHTMNTIGGSYVGDLYYNLRELYWIGGVVFGCILSKVSRNYDYAIEEKVYSKLIYSIPIILNSFWLVRDSTGNIIRPIVWQIVLSLIILTMINKKSNSIREHS